MWVNDIRLSYGNNHSAAVAVLTGAFKGKVISTKTHHSGRWFILTVKCFYLGIFMHPTTNKTTGYYFKKLKKRLIECISGYQNDLMWRF